MIKTSDFPYPVLRNDRTVFTSYKREFYFKIDIDEPQNGNGEYVFNLNYDTNSGTIKSLLEDGLVSIYISYQTNVVKRTILLDKTPFDIHIPYSILQSFDEIVFSAKVIANNDFELKYNDEMDDAYNLDLPYFITKKDIIAIANDISFDFNKTGKTIIKLIKSDDLSSSFVVDINDDDFILIKINPNFKKSYDTIQLKQSEIEIPIISMIHSSLINMAMINVFMKLINEGYERHSQKRWFKVIKNTFNAKDIIFEEELEDLKNDNDSDRLFSLVDKFLNSFFDKSIAKCSEVLK